MKKGFEEITKPLTKYEQSIVPDVVREFEKHVGIHRQITTGEIIQKMKAKGYRMSGPRLRKIVNYIRQNSIAPICGNGSGYWYASHTLEIEDQINSLEERQNYKLC